MSILIYVILSALLGFALSTYIFKQTKRETLEHKSMVFLDLIFIVSFVYGVVSLYSGIDMVLPKGLVLAVLTPLNLYVGIIAVHYRNDRINEIARYERKKEELEGKDYDVGNC